MGELEHKYEVEIQTTEKRQKISDQEKSDIFKPFFRSIKSRGKAVGFGLGLTICKKIIDAHSGEIELKTRGKETVFNIKIPIKRN